MSPGTKKLILGGVILGALVALVVAGVFSYVLVVAPHMVHQPHLRAFEAVMPLPPEGSLTVETQGYSTPSPEHPGLNPLQKNSANIERGATYYGYYCLQCHGENGRGHGPVGESYMPVPADLTRAEVQGLEDGRLLRRMLLGTGHEPVLSGIVPADHRWYLVLYVHSLAGKGNQ